MKNTIILVWITIVLLSTGCKKNDKPGSLLDIEEYESVLPDTKLDGLGVRLSNEKDQELFRLYLEIKDVLVHSDSLLVQSSAKKIGEVIVLSNMNKQLQATCKLISLTKNLKKQRDFFTTLTSEVEKRMRTSRIVSGAIYKKFCAKAFEGAGGYWLSDTKAIQNPYQVDKENTCVQVVEVIE